MASSRLRFVSFTPTTYASITYAKLACNYGCCIHILLCAATMKPTAAATNSRVAAKHSLSPRRDCMMQGVATIIEHSVFSRPGGVCDPLDLLVYWRGPRLPRPSIHPSRRHDPPERGLGIRSALEEPFGPRRHDEIVLVQASDLVRPPRYCDTAPLGQQRGMM